jgi:hypothetical protein
VVVGVVSLVVAWVCTWVVVVWVPLACTRVWVPLEVACKMASVAVVAFWVGVEVYMLVSWVVEVVYRALGPVASWAEVLVG